MSNGTITMTGAEYDALAGKIAALEAELAKLRAGQEPVAWRMWNGKTWRFCYSDAHGKRGWEALYTAQQQSAVPDDYLIVPIQPTEEMRKRAQDYLAAEGMIVSDWLVHTAYTEMLAAAGPSAPATVQGVNQQMLAEYPDEMTNGGKMANCNTDCRSAEGVTVGLIDGLITIARVLTLRDLSPAAVQEALIDLRSDEDLARVLGPAIGKGVNAQLLEALEALEEAARQVMAGEMAPSSIMVERMKSRTAIAAARQEGWK